ncbi:hypothetical protein DPMN_056685 [Dreissena polymorpha]|uniref:Uncharacterized protein n=1 Tax=Dreissena polymorpha TaxID=45954 RepID=A0A9D4HVA8_DREPO|nr:hypothetical protein DPMN_056685 [Dreissena polymorpha]
MVRPTVTQPHSSTNEMDEMRNTINGLQKTKDEMSKRPRNFSRIKDKDIGNRLSTSKPIQILADRPASEISWAFLL